MVIFKSIFPPSFLNYFQSRQSDEIDEMISRIEKQRGVMGLMVFDKSGVAIKSNLDEGQTNIWACRVAELKRQAKSVGKSISLSDTSRNKMTLLRIRSTKYEVMIAPENDHILVSIHQQVNEN